MAAGVTEDHKFISPGEIANEWRHVDVSGDAKPSESETFRMLANAIATGDPSLYKPADQPNSHWSNWLAK